jgi:hypothetical protein
MEIRHKWLSVKDTNSRILLLFSLLPGRGLPLIPSTDYPGRQKEVAFEIRPDSGAEKRV